MNKTFRGEAGDVTLGFVNPLTLLTALPVMVLNTLLFGLAAFFASELSLPPVVTLPLLVASISPVIGLFACTARRGKLDAGFVESLSCNGRADIPGFCLRFTLLSIAWTVPLVLLGREAIASVGEFAGAAMMGGVSSDRMGSGVIQATWLVMTVLALAALAPALSLLVAARTDSVSEVFSGRTITWLLKERGDDLVPFFATYIGGMFLFGFALLPLAVLAVPMAFSASEPLGQFVMMLLPALPFTAAPIFLGRLVGAFVAADLAIEPMDSAVRQAPRPSAPIPGSVGGTVGNSTLAGRTEAGLAGMPMQATASRRLDTSPAVDGTRGGSGLQLGVALARAHQRGEADPAGALADIEALRAQHPRNPAIAGEHARLLLRIGRDSEGRQAAAEAIRLALVGGAGPIAFDVFMAFAAHAPLLGLDAGAHEQLARILQQRQEFDGAVWCFRAAATLGGDLSVAQNGVLSAADAAFGVGQRDKAAEYFEGFLRTWPDSPLRSLAVDGLDKTRGKVRN